MALLYKIIHSSLFKASGIYTLLSIVNSGLPFLLLPILTRYLSPEDYGIVSMFTLIVSFVGVFTGLSVHGAINRVYFEKHINFKEYVANSIYILFGSSLLTFILIFVFRSFISKVSEVPENWVLMAVILSLFQFFTLLNLVIYQAQLKVKEYGFFQIGQTILNFFLTVLLVVFIGFKWEGRLSAQLISVVVFGIASFIILYKYWTKWKFNQNYIIHSLKFGIPLIPHSIGGMLMTITDRFIITNFLGIKESGIYTTGLQIGAIIGMIADAFNKAYVPWLFNKLNQNCEATKIKIVKFTYLYFIVIILLALIWGFIAPFFINSILGKDFHSSSSVVLWIALGNAFNGMYYMIANYIFYVYKTYFLTWITLICGILNVLITIFLVQHNGIIGAAQSYCITLFIFFIMSFIISIKVCYMPWRKTILGLVNK